MQLADMGPLPKPVRWIILTLLAVAVVASAGLLVLFTLIRPDQALAIVALGAVQAALTGFVVVSLVLFSFRMKQTRDIQRVIDSFFIDDLLPAFQGVDTAPSPFIVFETPRQFRKVVPKVKTLSRVETDFCLGRDAAGFRICKPGGEVCEVYVKVNAPHVTIKYFFDPTLFSPADNDAEFKLAFEQTLTGATSVGYTYKPLRRYHASRRAEVLELSLHFKLGAEFLANPAERLFLRNDLSTMTASMLHTLNGVRQVKAMASDRKAGAAATA